MRSYREIKVDGILDTMEVWGYFFMTLVVVCVIRGWWGILIWSLILNVLIQSYWEHQLKRKKR